MLAGKTIALSLTTLWANSILTGKY